MNATIHWAPSPEKTPGFHSFRSDEGTVKALATAQVELYKLRTAYNQLSNDARLSQLEWQRKQDELADELRKAHVRNAEAERLLKGQLGSLDSNLRSTEAKLSDLGQEHLQLKHASADRIEQLQQEVEQLLSQCDDLKHKRDSLERQLADAAITAQLRKEAEEKVAQLESSIAATKERARHMINDLQKEKTVAEEQRNKLQHRLQDTQQALRSEAVLRQQRETEALVSAIEQQRLKAALEVERTINRPLRETHYASTTLSHVMRSAASGAVAAHSRQPYTPTRVTAPPRSLPMSPDVMQAPAPAGQPGAMLTVRRPVMSQSLTDTTLTRLGRAWATTTPTAGHPHPVYADNVERYRDVYSARASPSSPVPRPEGTAAASPARAAATPKGWAAAGSRTRSAVPPTGGSVEQGSPAAEAFQKGWDALESLGSSGAARTVPYHGFPA